MYLQSVSDDLNLSLELSVVGVPLRDASVPSSDGIPVETTQDDTCTTILIAPSNTHVLKFMLFMQTLIYNGNC